MTRTSSILRMSVLAGCVAAAASMVVTETGFALSGGSGSQAQPSDDGRRRSLTSSETYLPLPPLMATVQADFRAAGLMQIEAGLEFHDVRMMQRAEAAMPRLRDAYVSALSLYAGMNYRFGDIPDAERISAMLQTATDHALGETGAEFLLGTIMIHAN